MKIYPHEVGEHGLHAYRKRFDRIIRETVSAAQGVGDTGAESRDVSGELCGDVGGIQGMQKTNDTAIRPNPLRTGRSETHKDAFRPELLETGGRSRASGSPRLSLTEHIVCAIILAAVVGSFILLVGAIITGG